MSQRRKWKVDLSVVDPHWADWSAPIVLRLSSYRREAVTNPAEALSFLSNRFAGERDALYLAARNACSAVLRRRLPTEQARLIFAKFAQDALLLGERAAPSGSDTAKALPIFAPHLGSNGLP
ncbi:DUF982 domain-containing protein [Neorhizobium turbinariae]|uniref:DUF982 domain-containing protein n=1 Tax=Neorhizobium turbinariae TaxID=2937795 RepID=UPI0036F2D84F